MKRVVFDTNIYISGTLFKGGIPSRLLEFAREGKFALFYSPEIIGELRRILCDKFELSLHEVDLMVRWLETMGSIVYPCEKLNLVKQCEEDNRILECTMEAKADYLVTGDKKHLLVLKHSHPFLILSPRRFYEMLFGQK